MPLLLLQRVPKAHKIFRLGSLPNGTGYPGDGEIVLPGPLRQDTHEMQGVRMARVRLERLLAADLGVEKPAGPHVAETGLMERAGGCGGTARNFPRCLAGWPAFTTTHLNVSGGTPNDL